MFKKTYKMKKYYKIDDLIVAQFVKNENSNYTTNNKYIFEIIKEKGKVKYREIISGLTIENNEVNMSLIKNRELFINYFPNEKEKISQDTIYWALKELNYPLTKMLKRR